MTTHVVPRDLGIHATGLTKTYGDLRVLDGIDLAVPRGSVLALLGPNGAGKTTTVRILATLTAPDAGSARVAGHDTVTERTHVRERISLTGQFAAVDDLQTGAEMLRMMGRLCGLSPRTARTRADELLARFGLTEAAARTAKTYSGGMRRRLDLAASLVSRPEVIFLDEPTTGLDPRSRQDLWELVRELRSDGTTVLLTTQYLEEADRLADAVVVVDRGRAVATGTPARLKARIGAYAEVTVTAREALTGAAVVLDQLTGGRPVLDEGRLTVGVTVLDTGLTLPRIIRALDTAGVPVTDASLRPPTLDEVFLRLTQAPQGRPADQEYAA